MLLTLPVREVLPATPRTRIVRVDLAGHSFEYQPGQAVFVGVNGTRAAYSLAGPPEDAQRTGFLELLVRVDQTNGHPIPVPTEPGMQLQIAGPVGRFTFPTNPLAGRRLVFVAGGTGIAPVRSMLRHALTRTDCDIRVLYSARTPDDFAYEGELHALAQRRRIELWQTVTRDADCAGWSGGRGRIGETVLKPLAGDPATLFFLCGPLTLVDETQRSLERLGVTDERIRTDRW